MYVQYFMDYRCYKGKQADAEKKMHWKVDR